MNTPESGKSAPVSIRILDREYTVGVSDAERASLTSAMWQGGPAEFCG